jgi:hypothetical protein
MFYHAQRAIADRGAVDLLRLIERASGCIYEMSLAWKSRSAEPVKSRAYAGTGSERGTRYHKPNCFNKNNKLPTPSAACVLCL